MSDTFKLPSSSYDELLKIIQAYASAFGKDGQAISLDTLVHTCGVSKSIISKNNGFLLEVELITPGKAKAPTETCVKLGRAYTHKQDEDAISIWREIVENNEFLGRMISAIKIRDGMDRVNFINHIIYSSGLDATKENKAGAGAVIEILKFARFLNEQDGKITAIVSEMPPATPVQVASPLQPLVKQDNVTSPSVVVSQKNDYKIVLNLNLSGNIEDLDGLATKVKKFIEDINN